MLRDRLRFDENICCEGVQRVGQGLERAGSRREGDDFKPECVLHGATGDANEIVSIVFPR